MLNRITWNRTDLALKLHTHAKLNCLKYFFTFNSVYFPVGWGYRNHQLLLYRGVRSPSNEYLGHDTKQSDGEIPVMQELWGMWSTSSLPLPLSPLWPRVVAPDRVQSMDQIEGNCVFMLNWTVWNRTVLIFNWTFSTFNCV